MSKEMTATETIAAWKMIVINRSVKENMFFHLDRGVQYATHEFIMLFKARAK